MRSLLTGRRGAGVAAAGLLGLGLGVGLGFSGTANAASTPAATTSPAPAVSADHPRLAKARERLGERRLAGHGLHGEATVKTDKGYEVVAGQRGKVTAINATSISLTSEDGYAATYVINGDTKVRADGKSAKVTDIHQGADVVVRAAVANGTRTATVLADPKD